MSIIKKNCSIITIDGPTASGKGSVAKLLADKLGWSFLDTGAIYRSLAFFVLKEKIYPDDTLSVLHLAKKLNFSFRKNYLYVNNLDVSKNIREEIIGTIASTISSNFDIRNYLIDIQRNCVQSPGLVADGRDMGTVVFPNADLKIFLTADLEVRIERRYKQLINNKVSVNISNLRSSIIERDFRDVNRSASPLKPASDAHILDSSCLTNEDTVNIILDLWANKLC